MVEAGKAILTWEGGLNLVLISMKRDGGKTFYPAIKLVHADSFIGKANTRGEFALHSAGVLG